MTVSMPHPRAKEGVRMIGNPIKMGETPITYKYPPPVLGQHTKEVLKNEIGLGDEEIQKLFEEGVVA